MTYRQPRLMPESPQRPGCRGRSGPVGGQRTDPRHDLGHGPLHRPDPGPAVQSGLYWLNRVHHRYRIIWALLSSEPTILHTGDRFIMAPPLTRRHSNRGGQGVQRRRSLYSRTLRMRLEDSVFWMIIPRRALGASAWSASQASPALTRAAGSALVG